MARFKVRCGIRVTGSIEVEAQSLDEAKEKAAKEFWKRGGRVADANIEVDTWTDPEDLGPPVTESLSK